MRVVLDTNILVSALIFPGGKPEAVYRRALDRSIDLVTSAVLLAELGRVLESKFDWEPERIEVAIEQIARVGDVVKPTKRLAVIEADAADDRVLEAAMEGKAILIVSGDKHLLELGLYEGIRVVDAARFLTDHPTRASR